ncbi:MAG: 50S ribosomal protein L18 [bacterium]|nr:50S ribosomal protein L18 [bacterium]
MKTKKFIPFRRKLQGKTNYRKRLELLKSNTLRIVVRRSLRNITVQAVEYHPSGDKTIFTVNSKDLKEFGWKGYGRNTPAGYLVGYLFGIKAQEKKIQKAILDQGLYLTRQGTITFSVLKGLVDSGMKIPHNAKIFPHEDRILGKHISEDITKQFSVVKANIQKVK